MCEVDSEIVSDIPDQCIAPVGDPPRAELVPIDVMLHAIEELSERARRQGKTGIEIDAAIIEALPEYLEALLYGAGERLH